MLTDAPAKLTPLFDQGLPSPGTQECGLAWTGDGFWHYDLGMQQLMFIARNGTIQKSLPLADCCCDTEFDGSYVWQCAPDQLKIFKIDPRTGAILHTITTPDKASGLCTDGLNWYRGSWSRKAVIQFDPVSGEELGEIATGATTSGLTSDGRYLWHAGDVGGTDHIFCLDPEQGKLVDSYPVDLSICGLTYDGALLWAACNRHHQLIPLRPPR